MSTDSVTKMLTFRQQLDSVFDDIRAEVEMAYAKFKPFNSAHEGYAVILEELDELWEEVKKKQRDREPMKMETEAVQVAAMAVRFLVDIVARTSPQGDGDQG